MASFAVILPAAGKSSRFGDPSFKKPFAPLENRPVWLHAAEKFVNRPDVKQTILVISPEDRAEFEAKSGASAVLLGIEVIDGGAERSDSVAAALARVRPEIEYIAVHDAARPCLAHSWIDRVFAAAVRNGAAMLAGPVTGTLKRVDSDNTVEETVPRGGLWEAQTPQVFRRQWLYEAYAAHAQGNGAPATDDAQLVERMGHKVAVIACPAMNIKITTTEDLTLAAAILKVLPKPKSPGPAHPHAGDAAVR